MGLPRPAESEAACRNGRTPKAEVTHAPHPPKMLSLAGSLPWLLGDHSCGTLNIKLENHFSLLSGKEESRVDTEDEQVWAIFSLNHSSWEWSIQGLCVLTSHSLLSHLQSGSCSRYFTETIQMNVSRTSMLSNPMGIFSLPLIGCLCSIWHYWLLHPIWNLLLLISGTPHSTGFPPALRLCICSFLFLIFFCLAIKC